MTRRTRRRTELVSPSSCFSPECSVQAGQAWLLADKQRTNQADGLCRPSHWGNISPAGEERGEGRGCYITDQNYLLLLTEDDGGDVPQLRQLLVQRVAFLISRRIRVLTGLVVGQHFSLVNKPVTALLELHWAARLCQTACPALVN